MDAEIVDVPEKIVNVNVQIKGSTVLVVAELADVNALSNAENINLTNNK